MSKRIHKGELKPRRHHWHSLELVGCRVGFLCFNNICSLEFKFQAAQNGHKFSSKVIVMYTMLSSSEFQIEVLVIFKVKNSKAIQNNSIQELNRLFQFNYVTQVDDDSIDALLFQYKLLYPKDEGYMNENCCKTLTDGPNFARFCVHKPITIIQMFLLASKKTPLLDKQRIVD